MSNDLMQKLAMSKKIMDRHNQTPRGQQTVPYNQNINENVNYNIPEGVMQEQQVQKRVEAPINTKPLNKDAVLNSKLPNEIKKLMIENPIVMPEMGSTTLSDEVIEGATRLMNNKTIPQTGTLQNEGNTITTNSSSLPNNSDLKQMITEVVRDVVREELKNSGLLSESTQKTSEQMSLRVGKHIFEGKILKIKKLTQ